MSVALLLSGGAPNSAYMAGGLVALDEKGVEYSVLSTSGAGILVGLLYAAPAGEGTAKELRREALKKTVDISVNDLIYKFMDAFWFYPANYKVFHKPGALAEVYTRFVQMLPKLEARTEAERFFNDAVDLVLSIFCPTDLGPWSKGMCQPPPFIEQVVDFEKLRRFDGHFYLNAYCLEDKDIVLFKKDEITAEHFQAAIALPLIYKPFELNGKHYIEGSAVDTISYRAVLRELYEPAEGCQMVIDSNGRESPDRYRPREGEPTIDTLVVFDMLGYRELIHESRHLLDALSQLIVVPLTALTRDDTRLFELEHLHKYPGLELIKIPVTLQGEEWKEALEWSYSNAKRQFERGYEQASKVYEEHKDRLAPKRNPVRLLSPSQEDGPIVGRTAPPERSSA
jgi:NTE family protein